MSENTTPKDLGTVDASTPNWMIAIPEDQYRAFQAAETRIAELEAQVAKLVEALTAAANQLEKVHSDAFRQSGGQGLCTPDGRAFSCFEINNCDGAARTARAALSAVKREATNE